MSQHRTGLLRELSERLRERGAGPGVDPRRWAADVRREPALLSSSLPLRIRLWLGLGTGAVPAVGFAAAALPPLPGVRQTEQSTRPATLCIACTSPNCRYGYVAGQPTDFSDWRLTCERCGRCTVYRARIWPQCHRWHGTARGGEPGRPCCTPAETEQAPAPKPVTTIPDDAEDRW